jgi:hypothetical protein
MADCHLGLGILYRKTTQARARREIEIAIDEYRAMGSTAWLNGAEIALQTLDQASTRES